MDHVPDIYLMVMMGGIGAAVVALASMLHILNETKREVAMIRTMLMAMRSDQHLREQGFTPAVRDELCEVDD